MTTDEQRSLLKLHLSVLLFAGTALFARLIPLSATDITAYRIAIAAATLGSLLLIQRRRLRLHKSRDYGWALLLGMLVGLHWVTYFDSMQKAGVALGIMAFFTYPVITVLIEPVLEKRLPAMLDLAAGAWVLAGVWLILPDTHLGSQATTGVLTGILSALLFALRNIFHKRHFCHYSGPHAMFYQMSVAVLMLLWWVETPPGAVTDESWLLLILLGTLFSAAPHALFAGALQHLSATTISMISCLQPFYATLLSVWLLGERLTLPAMVGGTMVVSAALFETWKNSRKRRGY